MKKSDTIHLNPAECLVRLRHKLKIPTVSVETYAALRVFLPRPAPSVSTLARQVGKSRKRVREALTDLETRGLIHDLRSEEQKSPGLREDKSNNGWEILPWPVEYVQAVTTYQDTYRTSTSVYALQGQVLLTKGGIKLLQATEWRRRQAEEHHSTLVTDMRDVQNQFPSFTNEILQDACKRHGLWVVARTLGTLATDAKAPNNPGGWLRSRCEDIEEEHTASFVQPKGAGTDRPQGVGLIDPTPGTDRPHPLGQNDPTNESKTKVSQINEGKQGRPPANAEGDLCVCLSGSDPDPVAELFREEEIGQGSESEHNLMDEEDMEGSLEEEIGQDNMMDEEGSESLPDGESEEEGPPDDWGGSVAVYERDLMDNEEEQSPDGDEGDPESDLTEEIVQPVTKEDLIPLLEATAAKEAAAIKAAHADGATDEDVAEMIRRRRYREHLEVQAGFPVDTYAPVFETATFTPPKDEDATQGLQGPPVGEPEGEVIPMADDDLELGEKVALRFEGEMEHYLSLPPEGRLELLYELKIRSVAEEALNV